MSSARGSFNAKKASARRDERWARQEGARLLVSQRRRRPRWQSATNLAALPPSVGFLHGNTSSAEPVTHDACARRRPRLSTRWPRLRARGLPRAGLLAAWCLPAEATWLVIIHTDSLTQIPRACWSSGGRPVVGAGGKGGGAMAIATAAPRPPTATAEHLKLLLLLLLLWPRQVRGRCRGSKFS